MIAIPAQAGTHAGRKHDVLRLFACQQTLRNPLCRNDKNKVVPGFTRRYGVDRLVWLEAHEAADAALRREKQIKEWKRDWKINLIERENQHWIDLFPTLTI
jgi:putative endonuclease